MAEVRQKPTLASLQKRDLQDPAPRQHARLPDRLAANQLGPGLGDVDTGDLANLLGGLGDVQLALQGRPGQTGKANSRRTATPHDSAAPTEVRTPM